MTEGLVVHGLRAAAGGQEILRGIDLAVGPGEVHVIMGPNGSGKSTLSHVLAGRPGYEVLEGSVTLDGEELLGLEPWQRAQRGLFLGMQYPIEVVGVAPEELLAAALSAQGRPIAGLRARMEVEAERLGFDEIFLDRALNVDLSGGERKRNETLQLAVLEPRIAVLDEIDSGLDVDALRAVARRIEAATHEQNLGVLAITHYNRLLAELRADKVSIISKGRIVASGGPELALELEGTGYAMYAEEEPARGGAPTVPVRPEIDDPYADPLA